MKKGPDTRITRGTNNVFADLGFPDAETHLLKAELVTRIQRVITAQELTQIAAAKRMGLSQPDVSRLLNGQFRDVSVERLMRLLTRLGCDVDITVRNHGKAAHPLIDVLGAVVRVKPLRHKRELRHHQREHWQQECLAQPLYTGLNLPLADSVHAGDVINPFDAV